MIRPSALHQHINHTHHPLIATKKFCSTLVREYELVEEPQRLHRVVTAIFGLPLFPTGYLSCDECGATFQTKASILRHRNDVSKCASASYRERCAQAFFPESNRMFFGVVVPSTSPSSSKDPVVLIKKMYSPPDFSKVPINSASTFRDVHHFLRVENWAKHVEGMTGEAIPKAVRDREPELRENVRLIVEAYSKDMVKELLGTDHAIKIAIGDYNG